MSVEPGPAPQAEFASLQSCFVEGNPEQRARERRIRRRALIISISAQAAILTAIILIPLFGKPERIALANMVPIPPYRPARAPESEHLPTRPNIQHSHFAPTDPLSQPVRIPDRIISDPGPQEPPTISIGSGPTVPCVGCLPIDDNRLQPPRPPEITAHTPARIRMTSLEPAMLIHRVEPAYPTLMRQIRRSGRVELRAIIATDGTIKSLEAVSGDAGFIQSALDAVTQWRYKPTILNGQPVEIDTFISVTYNIQQ